MSALARTNTHHTDIASVQLNTEPAVTSISVSARIDYIQRFSKQVVLVIDNDTNVYTQVARQFITNLSKETSDQESNVAFVSASTKLNDIQMRCRLIEQLFANTLFDPEKSLVMSILQLKKQDSESITIVVEHAQALSLQMKYELCQLVEIANKTHKKINVVLFGQEQSAQQIAANSSIFKNKLAIIDAKSGQLFALEHAKFKHDNSLFTRKFWVKLMLISTVMSGAIALSWYALIEYDDFSLSQLPLFKASTTVTAIAQAPIESNSKLVNLKDKKSEANDVNELATAVEIHAAMLGNALPLTQVKVQQAKALDIMQALDEDKTPFAEPIIIKQELQPVSPNLIKEVADKSLIKEQVSKVANAVSPIMLTPSYYLKAPTGYVVQIVGFTDMALLKRFIIKYPELEYFSYQKMLNEQLFTVLTTRIFDNRDQAKLALQTLPKAIVERGTWIKELATVQAEINALN